MIIYLYCQVINDNLSILSSDKIIIYLYYQVINDNLPILSSDK